MNARTFLQGTEWADWTAQPIPKDAGARSYQRLTGPGGETVILAHDPSLAAREAFVKISNHLLSIGLSSPKVLLQGRKDGFLVLEDLGTGLFPLVISQTPDLQNSLYSAAIDAIFAIVDAPPPPVSRFGIAEMTDQAMLVFDWYGTTTDPSMKQRLLDVFSSHISAPDHLMLRDVHAENLLWLPDRKGPARIGLLDFQGARLASPLYDILSLLTDARRDVPQTIEDAALERAADHFGRPLTAVQTEAAALSLQRNLRILGVFARLCLRDSRPSYLQYVPRVRAHISKALAGLNVPRLEAVLDRTLPEATPTYLSKLEAKCGTLQKA